ncbi:hypothetical protein BDP27DRAFT_1207042 [Rhodocollybia butyracea]|uniref:DUF202 domain-containing protein n=1 Tax=Rhodocollybia butyracea TaxID=206335 RepID=A0A9P5QB63_9AGAR|nr:hypothetical protein BDP27DRAFT_1207042 [Rhodocollybia butyracea]
MDTPFPPLSPSPSSSPSPDIYATNESQSSRTKLEKRFKPTLILENCGSVARDHLASERTFLAYSRTSLAIAATGVALVQLLTISIEASGQRPLHLEPTSTQIHKYARPLGAAMVIFSIILLITGLIRYFSIQKSLTLNQFPVARVLIIALSLPLGVLIIVTFCLLVAQT